MDDWDTYANHGRVVIIGTNNAELENRVGHYFDDEIIHGEHFCIVEMEDTKEILLFHLSDIERIDDYRTFAWQ